MRIQSVKLIFAGSPEVLMAMPFYFNRQLQVTSMVEDYIGAFVGCHMPLWFGSDPERSKTWPQEANEPIPADFFVLGPLNAG